MAIALVLCETLLFVTVTASLIPNIKERQGTAMANAKRMIEHLRTKGYHKAYNAAQSRKLQFQETPPTGAGLPDTAEFRNSVYEAERAIQSFWTMGAPVDVCIACAQTAGGCIQAAFNLSDKTAAKYITNRLLVPLMQDVAGGFPTADEVKTILDNLSDGESSLTQEELESRFGKWGMN